MSLTSSFTPCFLSDDRIIQFKLAYLLHLAVMALVFCYHFYWLTCLSPWRRALTGRYFNVCAHGSVCVCVHAWRDGCLCYGGRTSRTNLLSDDLPHQTSPCDIEAQHERSSVVTCCYIMNHPDSSGRPGQLSELNTERQHQVFLLNISCSLSNQA